MRSSAVVAATDATAAQYNDLRSDAAAASWLLAHEQDTPDMTLEVEAGVAYVAGKKVEYAGGNSPTFTAPVSDNRIDLLVINREGTLSVVQGTPGASPSAPSYPGDKAVLCEVYLRSTSTTLRDTDGGADTGYIRKDVRPVMAHAAVTQDASQIFTADSGSDDAYEAAYDPAVSTLFNGMLLRFRAGFANSAAATFSPNGVSAKAIKKWNAGSLSDIETGDIVNGQIVDLVYDSANDVWILMGAGGNNPTKVGIQNQSYIYAADAGGDDTYAITLTPAPTAYAAGQRFVVLPTTANTGPATLDVNGLGAKAIKKSSKEGKIPLVTGDIIAAIPFSVRYDGTDMVLEGSPTVAYKGGRAIFSTDFAASARHTSATGGGGTIAFGADGLVITTNGDGYGKVTTRVGRTSTQIFNNNPIFEAIISYWWGGTTNGYEDYWGLGAITTAVTGHTFTEKHIGFKMVRAGGAHYLYGTVADGTTEATLQLATNLATDNVYRVRAVCDSVAGVVHFFYAKQDATAWTYGGAISTNYPSATTAEDEIQVSSTDGASSVNVQAFCYGLSLIV